MSSRALRKAQREREEQQRAQAATDSSEQSDQDAGPIQVVKKSAFDLLGDLSDDIQDGQDNLHEDDQDDGGVAIPSEQSAAVVIGGSTVAHKKKKKKKKKRLDGAMPVASRLRDVKDSQAELDEIDLALKQLSASGNPTATGSTVAGTNESSDEASRLLAIDVNHLHAQNEMRRLFGRAALEGHDDDQPRPNANIGGNRRQQRRVQQVGLAQALRGQGQQGGRASGLTAMALRRNIFIQGKEEWPAAMGSGLGMELVEKRSDGTRLYKIVHHRIYQDVQAQFLMAVESMDPNQLVALLQHNPYHISTLLQVSEIAKQERDHATSGDLLERALFALGRAVHSTFAKALAEGKARLDFREMENRELWLASWRYMQNLTMRATWRTVYEWAKLLLSLSPEEDPYALWLVLDQYAIRSKQELDYLNISRSPEFHKVHEKMPNVQLSQGLAEFRAGNPSKGRQALYTAIGRFPWVVARLMQELQLTPPPMIWGKEPRTAREKLHSELYATRAKDLWNTPEASELLLEVASAIPPETPSVPISEDEITINEARHVLLSDTPALIALIPRSFTTRLTSSSDPLPPEDAHESYLKAFKTSSANTPALQSTSSVSENFSELQGLYSFFRGIFPWFSPGNSDSAPPDFTVEDIEQRIRESGVPDEVVVQRTGRMMDLQARLAGQLGSEEMLRQLDQADVNSNGDGEHEEGDLRARVEDASDDTD